jgi:hypothetical protein
MNIKRLIAGLLAVTLLVTSFAGCTNSQSSPIKLVPQAANLVAEIQISNIINNPILIRAYDSTTKNASYPQTVQEALDKMIEKTGINIQDFSQVLIFGDINNIPNFKTSYMGVIAQGTFIEQQFVQNIEDKTGKTLSVIDYKGSKLYSDNSNQYSLVFFSGSMLVFGTPQALKDCVDIRKGDKQSLTGTVIDTYNKLGSATLRAAFTVPDEAKKTRENNIPGSSTASTQSLSKMDVLGLSLNIGLEDVTVNLDLHFLDTTSAQDAKDTISGAVSLLKGTTTNSELKTLLGEIKFSTSDVWLTTSLKTTLAELQSLPGITTNK